MTRHLTNDESEAFQIYAEEVLKYEATMDVTRDDAGYTYRLNLYGYADEPMKFRMLNFLKFIKEAKDTFHIQILEIEFDYTRQFEIDTIPMISITFVAHYKKSHVTIEDVPAMLDKSIRAKEITILPRCKKHGGKKLMGMFQACGVCGLATNLGDVLTEEIGRYD